MKTEVRTLIAALTTERDSIDRAITSLKAMSDSGGEPAAVSRRPRKQTRHRIAPDAKASIAIRMAASGNKAAMARALANEYGLNQSTIYTRWNQWKAAPQPVNGADQTAIQ